MIQAGWRCWARTPFPLLPRSLLVSTLGLRKRAGDARTGSRNRFAMARPSPAEIGALNSAAEDQTSPGREGNSPNPVRIPERPRGAGRPPPEPPERAAEPARPPSPVHAPGARPRAAGAARAPRAAPPATQNLWLSLGKGGDSGPCWQLWRTAGRLTALPVLDILSRWFVEYM